MVPISSAIGWSSPGSDGTGINSWWGHNTMLMPDGNIYDTFIAIHPFETANYPAYKTYALNGQYHTFTAILGNARYGDNCIDSGDGSYTMSILVDGRIEYTQTGWAPIQTYYEHVSIDVSGAMTLRIETTHSNSFVCDYPVFAQPILCERCYGLGCDTITDLTESQSTECDLGSINSGEEIECKLNVTYPEIEIGETTTLTAMIMNSFNVTDSTDLNTYCENPRISYSYIPNDFNDENDEYIAIYEGQNTPDLISTCSGIASYTLVSSLNFNSGDVRYSTTDIGVGYWLSAECSARHVESFRSGGWKNYSCSFTVNEAYQVDNNVSIISITVFYQYLTGFALPDGPDAITSAGTPTKVFLVITNKDDSTELWRSQFPALDNPNYWYHNPPEDGCIDNYSPLQRTEFVIPSNVTLKDKTIEFSLEFHNDERNIHIYGDTFQININYIDATMDACDLNSCLNNYQLSSDYNDSNVIDISIYVSKRGEGINATSSFNDICPGDNLIDSTITLTCQRSAPIINPTTAPSFEPTIDPIINPTGNHQPDSSITTNMNM